jgi:hypothetical protein
MFEFGVEVEIEIEEEVSVTGDMIREGASTDDRTETGTKVEVDGKADFDEKVKEEAEVEVGAELELCTELWVGAEVGSKAEDETAADFVLVGNGDVWLESGWSKRVCYHPSVSYLSFLKTLRLIVLGFGTWNARKGRATYLTCCKLMAEVGAVHDQSKADGEPDDTESADQKGAAVAVFAHGGGDSCVHLGQAVYGAFV